MARERRGAVLPQMCVYIASLRAKYRSSRRTDMLISVAFWLPSVFRSTAYFNCALSLFIWGMKRLTCAQIRRRVGDLACYHASLMRSQYYGP